MLHRPVAIADLEGEPWRMIESDLVVYLADDRGELAGRLEAAITVGRTTQQSARFRATGASVFRQPACSHGHAVYPLKR